MDIFLSVNNRQDVVKIPVLPESFDIKKSYNNTEFETVDGSMLLLIGAENLKEFSFSSFFPNRKNGAAPYIRNTSLWDWDYIYKIDSWYQNKLPMRLIVTYENSDTPINIAVTVSSFDYNISRSGDLYYSISLKQIPLLGTDSIVRWYN